MLNILKVKQAQNYERQIILEMQVGKPTMDSPVAVLKADMISYSIGLSAISEESRFATRYVPGILQQLASRRTGLPWETALTATSSIRLTIPHSLGIPIMTIVAMAAMVGTFFAWRV